MKRILFTLSILVAALASQAQTNLDSLWGVWNDKTQPDTTRLKAMHKIAWDGYLFSQPDSAFYFAQMEYDLAEKSGLKKQMSSALTTQGVSFAIRGDYPKALNYFQKYLKMEEEIGDKKGIASALNNVGRIYKEQGDYPKALDYFQRSLKINEEIGVKSGIVMSLDNIGYIYRDQGQLKEALDYYERSLQIEEEIGNQSGIAASLIDIGYIYAEQGKIKEAVDYYERSLQIEEEIGNKSGIANSLFSIGNIYKEQGQLKKALDYSERSLQLYEELGEKYGIAASLISIGNIYLDQGQLKEALDYYERGLQLSEEVNNKSGIASSLNNIGRIYYDQGNLKEALDYYERSLQLYEELGLKKGMSISLKNIGDIYKDQGKLKEALQYLNKSMTIAQALSAPDRIRDAAGVLKEIYKTQNEGMKAMEMFELEIQMRDSIQSEEAKKGLIKMELEHEYVKKELIAEQEHQKEIYEKNKTRNYLAGGGLLALIMAGGVLTRLRYVRKAKSIVEKEKDRSESLLLNILPYEVAEELKEKGHSDATLIDEVTVIFTDFKGFTAMSEQVTPKELVADLHACFSEFDHICEKYGIEKIKTIGDSYMAAGGLPTINQTHATDVVKAALEMAAVVENGKAEKIAQNLPYFEMRLGAHTGPVVAGIVGVKKFQYDIWGDTVNIASRMESSGEVGKVNISQFTYELIKDNSDFTFESRGKLEAKGKGEVEMYFVSKA